jgi:alanine dehydrogenase
MEECVGAVEAVFRRLAAGAAPVPGVLGFESEGGGFHLKAGLSGDGYFVAKLNGNFPANPSRGLPTIQGLALLYNAADGRPLAVIDSAELTARRTGAATGVAAKYLTPDQALVVTIIGCGRQAMSQLEAVAAVRPIAEVRAIDQQETTSAALARACPSEWRAAAVTLREMGDATRSSNVIITCTPSRTPFLRLDATPAECLIAAVGADNPHKSELFPELLSRSRVITDLTAQCATIGDLHHAIEAGVMTEGEVEAELSAIVAAGAITSGGRVVFDSTGMALQDAAAARIIYERAVKEGRA